MKNSGFDDDGFISSGKLLKEEDEKTMNTCAYQEKEEDGVDDDDYRSVWTPRSRGGAKREEGLLKTMMITRPKGGKRYLCMDSEEMKACKDLGFEFDGTKMTCVASGSASPTPAAARNITSNADWHISNPGDDPRDVKARLKLWAQAVAKASSSRGVRG